MNSEKEMEFPQVYRHHVFACNTQRPPGHAHGSCGASGAQALWDRMGKAIEAQGLNDIGFTWRAALDFVTLVPCWSSIPVESGSA